jgi:hypothetical protein
MSMKNRAWFQKFQMRDLGWRVLDFKAVNHEAEEVLPTIKEQIASQGSKIM